MHARYIHYRAARAQLQDFRNFPPLFNWNFSAKNKVHSFHQGDLHVAGELELASGQKGIADMGRCSGTQSAAHYETSVQIDGSCTALFPSVPEPADLDKCFDSKNVQPITNLCETLQEKSPIESIKFDIFRRNALVSGQALDASVSSVFKAVHFSSSSSVLFTR